MKRLRELEAQTPLMRKAQALIDSVDQLPQSQERMLRVRRALDQKQERGWNVARLPAFGLAALVVLFGASAFAAVRIYAAAVAARENTSALEAARTRSTRAARGKQRAPATVPTAVTAAAPMAAAPMTAAPAATAPVAATAPIQVAVLAHDLPARSRASGESSPEVAVASSAEVEPLHHANARAKSTSRNPAVRNTQHPRANPQSKAISTPATPATPAATAGVVSTAARGSDSELVHRAVKALRRDHDPGLAARLLEVHRARYPKGPLAEEALSLQIEAASQLQDARASAFAREYLARYPAGRYLSVAQQALQEPAP